MNAIENGMAYANIIPMTATVTLDKAGRLVLPKPVRDQLHLRAGSKLRLDVTGDRMELTQEVPEVKIVQKKDGLPVVVGSMPRRQFERCVRIRWQDWTHLSGRNERFHRHFHSGRCDDRE